MRLSNRNKAPGYNFINTLLLMILVGGIASFFLEEYKFNVLGPESYLLIIIPIIMLCFFYLAGRQIFEYDSDGEALNFKNRNVFPFLDKPLSDEFPKYKLMHYEIVNLFFVKRLYITISSKNSGSTMLKYEISYLTKKEINDLKFSLNKVVKTNKERKR
ncbi:hypothetical protein IQ37_03955 [Chryseobacterium piperi]|uniref:DUF304 domain-containing protein n=1 Tax=Chryseobacterium piperi TaxID=558152 RepID=A0A086BLK1_9FLAO|nr:hypothetical protein [Chryseobacterium piperi]ASW73279.1 hypothetical protein CJF12_02535 [Chryseobacterium piperi]KFF29815.1 hypothetical protein IQ37_03955 [Chryseobacterium piperi]